MGNEVMQVTITPTVQHIARMGVVTSVLQSSARSLRCSFRFLGLGLEA